MCFRKKIVLCRKGLKFVDIQEEERQRIAFLDKRLSIKMLAEQGLKLLPENHGTRIGRDGVWLKLAYEYREFTYWKGDEEYINQHWTYYGWSRIWKRWLSEGGHTQIFPKEMIA